MVARPTKPSPLASSSSANACIGGRYRSVVPTTRNGTLRGPIRVTPDVPSMCLLIGTGGSRPLSRSTRQSPSSEPATTTLERTNQQIDDKREEEREEGGEIVKRAGARGAGGAAPTPPTPRPPRLTPQLTPIPPSGV